MSKQEDIKLAEELLNDLIRDWVGGYAELEEVIVQLFHVKKMKTEK